MSTLNDLYLTIWSRSRSSDYWVIERSYGREYVERVMQMPLGIEREAHGRIYRSFEKGINPNEEAK